MAYLGSIVREETLDIVQEYIPSQTLELLCKDLLLANDENTVAKYSQDILYGMEFLHQQNITHGNIKAANVFVRDDGTCLLADFGQIKSKCEGTPASILDAPYWSAPELIQREGRYVTNRF